MCRGRGERLFESGCAALPQPMTLRSYAYTFCLTPGLLASFPTLGIWWKTSSTGCGPGWASGGTLALVLARTLGCTPALRRPGPMLLLNVKLLVQAEGLGHHLPSLSSTKAPAIARRWPLLLATTSRRSIPPHAFGSTSPQSFCTIHYRARLEKYLDAVNLEVVVWVRRRDVS
jgi:hypothetical protein